MAPTPLQNRKYLCQAPRPEVWADISETVLTNLGKNAEGQLQETLSRIQASHPLQPRLGPGRKSNAEHAIHFYEYLLQQLRERKEEPEEASSSTSEEVDDPNDGDEEEEEDEKMVQPDSEHESEEEVDDEDSADGAGDEIVSMDTPTFNAQHNDICEVCDEAGELLMCGTCNLVFHLECVRPKMDKMPLERLWRCSYCILTSNHKKSSKPHKRATAAVRQMARLREQRKREKREDKANDDHVVAVDEDVADDDEHRKSSATETNLNQQEGASATEQEEIDAKIKARPGTEQTKRELAVTSRKEESDGEKVIPAATLETESLSKKVKTPLKKLPEVIAVPTPVSANKEGKHISKRIASPNKAIETKSPVFTKDEESEEDFKSGPADAAIAVAESTVESLGVADESGGKRSASDTTPGEMSSPEGRRKRSRKQPTLYDPQAGPASLWQTDELKEWKAASRAETSDKSDTEEDKEATLEPAKASENVEYAQDIKGEESLPRSGRKSVRESIDGTWCSFCKDDPNVPICVFCACRVCFGKHNQTNLLLCDQCDEEYHTFCLDPPLDSVPSSKQWYCPTCKTSIKAESPRSSRHVAERASARSKIRDRATTDSGRKSIRTPSPKRSSPAIGAAVEQKAKSSDKKATGRPRGRPPKSQSEPASGGKSQPTSGSKPHTSSGSKKRGRPSTTARAESEPPRKRGRPLSAATLAKRAKAGIEPRKAGRLGSTVSKISSKAGSSSSSYSKRSGEPISSTAALSRSASMDRASDPTVASRPVVPVTVSRSGRTVRRSNFHDERHEGEQQLKSARFANENMEESQVTEFNVEATAQSHIDPTVATDTEAFSSLATEIAMPGQINLDPTIAAGVPGSQSTTRAVLQGPPHTQDVRLNADALSARPQLKAPPVTAATLAAAVSTGVPTLQASLISKSVAEAVTGAGSSSAIAVSAPVSDVAAGLQAAKAASAPHEYAQSGNASMGDSRQPRRKPGARECMQISRRFGVKEIPQHYMDTLLDYCTRGKVEHLIRMRERLDDHSRFLESQLAGLECLVLEHGESDIVVPLAPPSPDRRHD